MKIREIIGALEQFAPLSLQDSYDNAGLQIGLTEDADVSGALLSLDVTEHVIAEAVRLGCNLVVSHHPLLFRPMKRITADDSNGRIVLMAIKYGIAVYSAHTNLDNAYDGVSYEMGRRLGLMEMKTLSPSAAARHGKDDGAGVIGCLPAPMTSDNFLKLVKDTFSVGGLRHNVQSDAHRMVSRVALCGGAGAFLIPEAIANGADAFVTGEIGYHRFFGYEDSVLLAETGHFESERFTVDLLESLVRKVVADTVPLHTYKVSDPTRVL